MSDKEQFVVVLDEPSHSFTGLEFADHLFGGIESAAGFMLTRSGDALVPGAHAITRMAASAAIPAGFTATYVGNLLDGYDVTDSAIAAVVTTGTLVGIGAGIGAAAAATTLSVPVTAIVVGGAIVGYTFGPAVNDATLWVLTNDHEINAYEGVTDIYGDEPPAPCFPAGTPIALADGSVSKIEDVEAGSQVKAFLEFGSEDAVSTSPVDAALTEARVVRTFNNVTEDWVEVHFTDPATGKQETLTATPGHVMLTPEGGYRQLIEMIEQGSAEPELGDDRTDVQSLGDYTGSVRLVLADSQIVTAQAWSIKYSEATAHLYEEAEMLVTRTEGGLAVQPEVKRGWKTYNFEVEKYHTYIAGGVRVHNMSEHVRQAYGDDVTFVGDANNIGDGYGGQSGNLAGYDHNGNLHYYDADTDAKYFTHLETGVTYRKNKSNTMLTQIDDNYRNGVDSENGTSTPYEHNVGDWHFDEKNPFSPYHKDYDHSQVVRPGSPDNPNVPSQPSNPGGSDSGGSGGGGPQWGTPPNPTPHPGSGGSGSGGSNSGGGNSGGGGYVPPGNGQGAIGGQDSGDVVLPGSQDAGNDGGGGKPVLLDLDDDGLDVTELDTSTVFLESIDDGLMRRTAWAGAGDGVLFFDANGDGEISSTREYVFTEWDPTAASDLDALKSVFDTNGDGKLTSADDGWASFKVAVTQADGSIVTKTLAELDITGMDLTGSATQIELPDGSVITGTTEFTYGDGSTGTASELTLRTAEQGYDVEQVESVNANGDRVQTTTALSANGSIAFTIESTISADGSSTVNRYDMDGDGVVDQVQTITITNVTGGTQKDETLHRGTDVASGILLEAVRTTKIEAAGIRTETVERDSSGGGWYNQVEVCTTNLADDSLVITVTDLAQDGTATAILTKTVSADGLTRTEKLDVDADGAFEERLVHQITIDPVSGARTETTTRYNPDGSVRDVTTETVSADGQTRSVATDADGNGANETSVATAISVNVDGSTRSQFTITNEDGSVRSSQTQDQSDDALTKTVATDLDGDGTTDLTETDATVLAVDGSRTQTVTQKNGDGSLLSARETWLAENRIETTTHVDLDRSGTFDADEILQDVSLDGVTGEVTAKSYARAVNGAVLAEETRVTSADGLTTQTSIDADGDGDDDSVIDDVTTINVDGSSTQVITTKNGDATVRSTVTKWVSADGLTARVETDSDGNGVLDQVDHVAQVNNVDGSTTTTSQNFAGDGTTLLASSTTDHSADRRTTTTQTDSNGDGAIDRTSVRVEAIDGSVSLTETALNEDGSVARSSTTTVSADGLTTVVSNDVDGDGVADTATRTTTVHNLNGSRTDTVRTENNDGTLRAEQVLTTSDDGHTSVVQVDEDGDGATDRTVTTTRSYDADGTQRTVEILTATNGAVLNRIQTLVSDDGLTTDVQLDADGDGLFDLTTQSVTTLQADGSTAEVIETRDASTALRNSTTVTTSDDGRVRTVETDVDGDGNVDHVEQTVIADDGSATTTRSSYNPDGSLQSQVQTTTGGTGLVSEERYDQDGDGTFERVEKSTTVLNADGSTTTTTDVTSADASKSFEETVIVSDDGRQVVTTTDVDGDGVVDFTTSETTTLATDGVTTLHSETRSRDATLIESTERVVSADRDTVTETVDWNGDGQADAITTTSVGADGWVNATTITYAANGTVEGSHTVKTSDDGLTRTIEHDVLNDGQIELTTQDVSTLQADGSVLRTVTHTDQAGQMLAQEEYLTSDDGLSSTISMDLDGDGVDDTIEQIDFETKLDGSTERTSRTTDGSASLLAQTVTVRSADGLTETTTTDLDGDGQNDRVDTMARGADGGYVQTIETFDSTGALTSSRTITLSADERAEQRDVDLDGDGVWDQQYSQTLNADQSTTTLYSDVDGATTQSVITQTVEANGLDSFTTYDLDGDGSAEFTRSFTTDFAADGSEIRTLMDTADTGQKVYEEIRTIDADGLTTTTTYDYDGDGVADTTKHETIVINADGSRTQTTCSTYADGSLHSQTISDTSYDGKSRHWRTDRDGNGVIDKEQQITVHADGERVETNTTYNATGTVIRTSTTTTSSDGFSVVTVHDDTTETMTYSPTNTDSYTWAYEITLTDGTYEVTSDHQVGNDDTQTWTYTKVYSTWQQGSTYTPDTDDLFTVGSRSQSQIKTQNGWTQWRVTEVTETRLDAQTKQRLFDEVEKLYDTLLDRDLSSSEYEKLIGYSVDGVLDLETLAKELRESDEFVIRFGDNLSDTHYIQQLYINTLGRAPTMVELASDLASLGNKADPWSGVADPLDRDGLAARLALSAEHELAGNVERYTDNYDAVEPVDGSSDDSIEVPDDFKRYQDKGQVEAQIKGVFHALYDREPTHAELDSTLATYLIVDAELDWVVAYLIGQNLDASNSYNIGGLAGSALVTQAYVNALGRSPSQQEHDAWVGMLADGTLTDAQFIATLAENASTVTIVGTDAADTLVGLTGGEIIIGGDGDDTLTGGTGDDTLAGGAGSDTYHFSRGDGADVIDDGAEDVGSVDQLVLASDILTSDVIVRYSDDRQSIILRIAGTDDSIVLKDNLASATAGLDEVVFADGTVWDVATLDAMAAFAHLDRVLVGTTGNDTLTGIAGDDHLSGGTGDDLLIGGEGSDTYIFNRGDGTDTIDDGGQDAGDRDRLVLNDILISDITVENSADGQDLILKVNGTTDSVVLKGMATPEFGAVDEVVFADGTIWDRAILKAHHNQTIYGTVAGDHFKFSHTSEINTPNHAIKGSAIYAGDGHDHILIRYDNNGDNGGSGNKTVTMTIEGSIIFGGYGTEFMVIKFDNNGGGSNNILVMTVEGITIFGNDDTDIMIISYDNNGGYNSNGNNTVTMIVEGGTISGGNGIDDIDIRYDNNGGYKSSGNNTVTMTVEGSATSGGEGDDQINIRYDNNGGYKSSGNNTVAMTVKGSTISGGEGDDRINIEYYNENGYLSSGTNTVTMTIEGITISGGNGDDYIQIILSEDDSNPLVTTHYDGETIYGDAGNDTIIAAIGDDLIDFGTGNDTATGGFGNDTFIFKAGYGADTITDFEGGAGAGDVVEFQNSLAADYAALQAFMDDFGGPDTVIDFGGGDSLTLQGITLADLHADDFRFVA